MKRFLILMLLLTSCSASSVQENANFVSVQPLPTPNVTSEKIQGSETGSLPKVSNVSKLSNVPDMSFPSSEKSNLTWEDD